MDRSKSDELYRLREQNEEMIKKKQEMEQELKKANWERSYYKRKSSQRQIHDTKVTATKSPTDMTPGEKRELESLVRSLEERNSNLKRQNMTLRNQNRQNAGQRGPRRRSQPPRRRRNSRKKSEAGQKSSTIRQSQPTKRDILSMIENIRESVADQFEKSQLTTTTQLETATIGQENVRGADLIWNDMQRELQEKKAQMTMLIAQYEKLQSNLKADRLIQQRALQQIEEYQHLLAAEKEHNSRLQVKVAELELSSERMESLQLAVEDLKNENLSLHERIKQLTANSYLGDQLESKRISKLTESYQKQISGLHEQVTTLSNQNQILENDLQQVTNVHEETVSEYKTLQTKYRESVDKQGILQTQIDDLESRVSRMSQDAGFLDADVFRPSKGLSFLEPTALDKCTDAVRLKQYIHELSAQNAHLIEESRKTEELLEHQVSVNQNHSVEMDGLRRRHETLTRDYETLKEKFYELTGERDVMAWVNSFFTQDEIDLIDYNTTDNLLVVQVNEGVLFSDYFGDHQSPLTAVVVDFHDFDSKFSDVCGGFNPKYNIRCRFRIRMDAFVVSSLQMNPLQLDLVHHNHSSTVVVCSAFVSLGDLLYTTNAKIMTEAVFEKNGVRVGSVHVIASLLRSVRSVGVKEQEE